MKLLRWAVAGASVYAVYKYSIGRKARGEGVLTPSDRTIADLAQDSPDPPQAPPEPVKRQRARSAKGKSR